MLKLSYIYYQNVEIRYVRTFSQMTVEDLAFSGSFTFRRFLRSIPNM